MFRSLCEFGGDCFRPRYFPSGAALLQKNTSVQNNHLRFHTMTSKKMVRSYYCRTNSKLYDFKSIVTSVRSPSCWACVRASYFVCSRVYSLTRNVLWPLCQLRVYRPEGKHSFSQHTHYIVQSLNWSCFPANILGMKGAQSYLFIFFQTFGDFAITRKLIFFS